LSSADLADHRPELGLQEGGSRRERRFLANANDDLLTQRLYLDGPILDLGLHLLRQRLGQGVGLLLRLLGLLGGIATALLAFGLVMSTRLIRIPGLEIQLGLGHVDGLLHDGVDGVGSGRPGRNSWAMTEFPWEYPSPPGCSTPNAFSGAGDLLELLHIHLGKGEQEHEKHIRDMRSAKVPM
jgi:hypothetical protein